jgi:DNA invertase Pin-like site-specific DNA recombinase
MAVGVLVAGDGVAVRLLGGPVWLLVAYVALGVALATGRVWLARRGRRAAGADATRVLEPTRTHGRHALGYVCVTRGEASSELATQSDAIREWAAEHGVALLSVFYDVEPQVGDFGSRPALRGTLERIAAGEADTLVTARLADLSPTVANLPPLLRWFTGAARTLVAIDLRLDTATEAGRLAAAALTTTGSWEHERLSERTRRGLQAARERGSRRGQASVVDVPELRERIQRMREQGMTLQAIADALNQAGVPTLRGGAKWRPSSVQRATGYRRPPSRHQGIELPDTGPGEDAPPPRR